MNITRQAQRAKLHRLHQKYNSLIFNVFLIVINVAIFHIFQKARQLCNYDIVIACKFFLRLASVMVSLFRS